MKRFIWVDLETTGLFPARDEILALGMIITDEHMTEIARFERIVHVPAGFRAMRDMSDYVREMHTKNGLLERVADSRLTLANVEDEAVDFLDTHLGPRAELVRDRPPMAGSSVHFDRAFIDRHCPNLALRFHYRLLDVSSFKVLSMATIPGAKEWNDSRPDAAHTPLADLEGSIAELAHWRRVLSGAAAERQRESDAARIRWAKPRSMHPHTMEGAAIVAETNRLVTDTDQGWDGNGSPA